jgi:hypothetical protein
MSSGASCVTNTLVEYRSPVTESSTRHINQPQAQSSESCLHYLLLVLGSDVDLLRSIACDVATDEGFALIGQRLLHFTQLKYLRQHNEDPVNQT